MAKKNDETQAQEPVKFSGSELALRARNLRKQREKGDDVSAELEQLIKDHRAYLNQGDVSEKDQKWARQHIRLLRSFLPEE